MLENPKNIDTNISENSNKYSKIFKYSKRSKILPKIICEYPFLKYYLKPETKTENPNLKIKNYPQ